MVCFYHRERQAVGTCKHCQRALCGECAVEFDAGLACPNRCEQAVGDLISLIDVNRRAVARPTYARLATPGFLAAVGLCFGVAGALVPGKVSAYFVVLGAIFIGFGAVQFVSMRRLYARDQDADQDE